MNMDATTVSDNHKLLPPQSEDHRQNVNALDLLKEDNSKNMAASSGGALGVVADIGHGYLDEAMHNFPRLAINFAEGAAVGAAAVAAGPLLTTAAAVGLGAYSIYEHGGIAKTAESLWEGAAEFVHDAAVDYAPSQFSQQEQQAARAAMEQAGRAGMDATAGIAGAAAGGFAVSLAKEALTSQTVAQATEITATPVAASGADQTVAQANEWKAASIPGNEKQIVYALDPTRDAAGVDPDYPYAGKLDLEKAVPSGPPYGENYNKGFFAKIFSRVEKPVYAGQAQDMDIPGTTPEQFTALANAINQRAQQLGYSSSYDYAATHLTDPKAINQFLIMLPHTVRPFTLGGQAVVYPLRSVAQGAVVPGTEATWVQAAATLEGNSGLWTGWGDGQLDLVDTESQFPGFVGALSQASRRYEKIWHVLHPRVGD